jgi:hypothetical protein
MSAILRQGAAILLCLTTLYLGLLGLALCLGPHSSQEPGLDASLAGNSIFMTEPKYIYLNRTPLRDSVEKIVLLGASNVDTGFDLGQLRTLLPASVTVHKLAIGGANMTEVREVIELVQEVQSGEARRHEIVVLGIWYGMFGEDRLRWYTPDRSPGDTDIDIERYRYGFERRTAHGPVPIVGWQYIDTAVTAIRPFLLLDKLGRDSLERLSEEYPAQPKDLDTAIMSEDERGRMMNYWARVMGPARLSTFDEQFAVFERSCDQILAEGSELVVIDLPLPKWHKQRSPYYSYYEDSRIQLMRGWTGRPGFVFLDMTEMDSDADFYDEVHPRPRVTISWARRLATALTHLLSPNAAVAGALPDNGSFPGSRIP